MLFVPAPADTVIAPVPPMMVSFPVLV